MNPVKAFIERGEPARAIRQLNTYSYVDSNPVNWIDIYGLKGGVRPGGGMNYRNQNNKYGSPYGKPGGINPNPEASVNEGMKGILDGLKDLNDMNFCDIWPAACTKIICVKWRCQVDDGDLMCEPDEYEFDYPGTPVASEGGWNPDYDPKCKCIRWRWK